MNLESVRKDFPILSTPIHGKPLIYLDNAATMQMPTPVLDALRDFYETSNANVHRGVHTLSQRATDAMETARGTVAAFLNAESPQQIVFTSGTTDSIHLISAGFSFHPGDEILVSEMEHHSNLLPWQDAVQRSGAVLRVIPVNDQGELDLAAFKTLLSPRTALIAVTLVSNVLGTVNPVQEICSLAHASGALVVVDAAQGMKLGKPDVQTMDCDYLAFSGHKLGALTGIGVLYGKTAALERLTPARLGGGMAVHVDLKEADYEDIPYRLEAGTPSYAGAVSLHAALDYLDRVGLDEIAEREQELTAKAALLLSELRGITLLGSPAFRSGAVSFTADGVHPYDLGTLMDAQGIAVRTGSMCAQPILRRFGKDNVLRVSPAFYNTEEELTALCQAVERSLALLRGGVS